MSFETPTDLGWWIKWWKGKPDLSNLAFMYPKHPRFKMIVFSWMTPNHYMKNGHVSTFPSIKKMLFRVSGGSFPPWRSTNCILTNFASQVFYKQHSMAFFHAIERTCNLVFFVLMFLPSYRTREFLLNWSVMIILLGYRAVPVFGRLYRTSWKLTCPLKRVHFNRTREIVFQPAFFGRGVHT